MIQVKFLQFLCIRARVWEFVPRSRCVCASSIVLIPPLIVNWCRERVKGGRSEWSKNGCIVERKGKDSLFKIKLSNNLLYGALVTPMLVLTVYLATSLTQSSNHSLMHSFIHSLIHSNHTTAPSITLSHDISHHYTASHTSLDSLPPITHASSHQPGDEGSPLWDRIRIHTSKAGSYGSCQGKTLHLVQPFWRALWNARLFLSHWLHE